MHQRGLERQAAVAPHQVGQRKAAHENVENKQRQNQTPPLTGEEMLE